MELFPHFFIFAVLIGHVIIRASNFNDSYQKIVCNRLSLNWTPHLFSLDRPSVLEFAPSLLFFSLNACVHQPPFAPVDHHIFVGIVRGLFLAHRCWCVQYGAKPDRLLSLWSLHSPSAEHQRARVDPCAHELRCILFFGFSSATRCAGGRCRTARRGQQVASSRHSSRSVDASSSSRSGSGCSSARSSTSARSSCGCCRSIRLAAVNLLSVRCFFRSANQVAHSQGAAVSHQ